MMTTSERSMQEVLVAEGFQVDVAKDGLDALGKLEVEARRR